MKITGPAGLDPLLFRPDDAKDFICTFGLTLGPADRDGGDLFYIAVCAPKRLKKLCEKDGYVWGRHHLVVPYFDPEKIRAIFIKFVNNCSGHTWKDIGLKLARLGAREFEDYCGPSEP